MVSSVLIVLLVEISLVGAWQFQKHLNFSLLELLPVAYQRAFAGMHNGIIIVNLDDRIQMVNPALMRLIGLNDTQTILTIQDTGCGIHPDDLPHIFDSFYRAAKHRPLDRGSGLGLAITKPVIEQHGGTSTVDSTIDAGTTFAITLPHQSSTQDTNQTDASAIA